jgi:hypothetical protein
MCRNSKNTTFYMSFFTLSAFLAVFSSINRCSLSSTFLAYSCPACMQRTPTRHCSHAKQKARRRIQSAAYASGKEDESRGRGRGERDGEGEERGTNESDNGISCSEDSHSVSLLLFGRRDFGDRGLREEGPGAFGKRSSWGDYDSRKKGAFELRRLTYSLICPEKDEMEGGEMVRTECSERRDVNGEVHDESSDFKS